MERYICIHGHFYQPPRENPWLETIELQDPAYPYHDWNERIAAECYAPNSASRILDDEGLIAEIVNNYAKISFDFGPTLLAWLKEKAPDIYQAILEADERSQQLFSEHGSALAQAYNHMIMPLANHRDKYTQVLWGIRDFEHRFGRKPEGMWLPETAVDLETLDIMAELGIRFTILAPHQARRVRPGGGRTWREVSDGGIDPKMPYRLHLASGRSLDLFFYDGPISRAVAFEGLLHRGETFAQRLLGAFSEGRGEDQLVHIATDGETYGHHHRFGEMALAYAIRYLESNNLARLTNYGEFLEKHPPTREVEILENTSWSCAHGVERWRSDCGCNTGGHRGWNQAWRAPLREALDWLRDTLASVYEEKGRHLLRDPWAARNDYIEVVLDRSPQSLEAFLSRHATRPLESGEKVTALKLLELQRYAMLMFTSCGWFFDDIAGLETVQVLQYAGRAIQLAQELWGDAIEPRFSEIIARANSNAPPNWDGRHIYERSVRPARVDLAKVGAHYAVSSLFEEYPQQTQVFCYSVVCRDYQSFETGRAKLALGQIKITSNITLESAELSFGVLHLGDHNLSGGVREFFGEEAYRTLVEEMTAVFDRADFPEVIRILDREFRASTYSLRSLFRDEQRKILDMILEATLAEVEALYRQLYGHHGPLMRFLIGLGVPLPNIFHTTLEFLLNADLRRAFDEESLDVDRVRALLEEVETWRVKLDAAGLGHRLRDTIGRMAGRLFANPTDTFLLQTLEEVVALARSLPFGVDLWRAQNGYYELLKTIYPKFYPRAREGDEDAQKWVDRFVALGKNLSIRVA